MANKTAVSATGLSPKKSTTSKKSSSKSSNQTVAASQYNTKKISPEERELKNKSIDPHKHYNHTSIDLILDDHEDRILELESIVGGLGPTIPKQKKVLFAIKAPNQGDEVIEVTDD